MPGPPQSEPPIDGPDLDKASSLTQPLAAIGRGRARRPRDDRQIRPGDVADEERVAGDHEPGRESRGHVSSTTRRCARAKNRGGSRGFATRPSSSMSPSRSGSCSYSTPGPARRRATAAPVASTRRPWPDRWSVWSCVSSTCSMAELLLLGDSRRSPRSPTSGSIAATLAAVGDQVGGAAAFLVQDLAEQHAGILPGGSGAEAPCQSRAAARPSGVARKCSSGNVEGRRRGPRRAPREVLAEARAAFLHVPLEHFLATPEGRAAARDWRRRLGA